MNNCLFLPEICICLWKRNASRSTFWFAESQNYWGWRALYINHLVQCPAQSIMTRAGWSRLCAGIPKDGDSMTAGGNLFQCVITQTVEDFSYVWMGFLVFRFDPIVSCPVTGHHWEGSTFFFTPHCPPPLVRYLHTVIIPSSQLKQSELSASSGVTNVPSLSSALWPFPCLVLGAQGFRWDSQCWVEGKDYLLTPAGNTSNSAVDAGSQ